MEEIQITGEVFLERVPGMFLKVTGEQKKQRKGTLTVGPRQWVRHHLHLINKKINCSYYFLLTNYIPGVLLISPLIFEMTLSKRNNYSSFADEKREGHRG